MYFQTANSTYDLGDGPDLKIRRLSGVNPPTPRFSGEDPTGAPIDEDGFKPYELLVPMANGFYIIWKTSKWGVRGTLTSTLRCVSCQELVTEPGCMVTENPAAIRRAGHAIFGGVAAAAEA